MHSYFLLIIVLFLFYEQTNNFLFGLLLFLMYLLFLYNLLFWLFDFVNTHLFLLIHLLLLFFLFAIQNNCILLVHRHFYLIILLFLFFDKTDNFLFGRLLFLIYPLLLHILLFFLSDFASIHLSLLIHLLLLFLHLKHHHFLLILL